MSKLFYIQLCVGDWLRDQVAGCSWGAQGLWVRMMMLMHDSVRYGYLCQSDGSPTPSATIALRCGGTLEQYEALLHELDSVGVPSRSPTGVIFSRRMVRDAEKRAQDADRQAKHREKTDTRRDASHFLQDNALCHASVTHSVTPLSQGSSSSSSEKREVPRANPARASPNRLKTEREQRRMVAARDQRLTQEAEVRRELMVGAGPIAVRPAIQQAAQQHAMDYLPPSEAEIERRRQAQKSALEQWKPVAK